MLCPTCGEEFTAKPGFHVDLDNNRIRVDGLIIKVRPLEAEFFFVLHEVYPQIAHYAFIMDRLYGKSDSSPVSVNITVHIGRMRKHLRPTNWRILNEPEQGYYLVEIRPK